jgi:hypothetical protein
MILVASFQYLSILTQKLKITIVNAQIYTLLKCTQIIRVIILNLYCNSLYLTHFIPGKLILYGRVLKPVACVLLLHKAADEIRITSFSDP